MANTGEDQAAGGAESSPFDRRVFRALFDIAKQYKRQFIVVSLFSFLYTGLDLLQPLVYREAINAVAGMFVNQVPAVGLADGGGGGPNSGANASHATGLGGASVLHRRDVLLLLPARHVLRIASRQLHGVEADCSDLRPRAAAAAELFQSPGQRGPGAAHRSMRPGGSGSPRGVPADRPGSGTSGGHLRHHAHAELGDVADGGMPSAALHLAGAAGRAAPAVESRPLLSDVGRHLRAYRRRDRRSEDGQAFGRRSSRRREAARYNRSAPTKSICAGSRHRRNTTSRRSPSAI